MQDALDVETMCAAGLMPPSGVVLVFVTGFGCVLSWVLLAVLNLFYLDSWQFKFFKQLHS
jgi:hypothetical protein